MAAQQEQIRELRTEMQANTREQQQIAAQLTREQQQLTREQQRLTREQQRMLELLEQIAEQRTRPSRP